MLREVKELQLASLLVIISTFYYLLLQTLLKHLNMHDFSFRVISGLSG